MSASQAPAPAGFDASARPQRPFLVLGIVLTSVFVQLLDISIVNVAIPSIQADLGSSTASIQLVLAGYQLAFACTLITTLVLARILQGLGSGLMFPQVLAVIQVSFPPAERGKAFGIFGATIGLATICAPLFGGLLLRADLLGTDVLFEVVVFGLATLLVSRIPRTRRARGEPSLVTD